MISGRGQHDCNEEWTPEAASAIELCKGWARQLMATIPCSVYLFGSAMYQGGDQFDAQLSDLDLVVVFDEDLDATERSGNETEISMSWRGLSNRLASPTSVTNVTATIKSTHAMSHAPAARPVLSRRAPP